MLRPKKKLSMYGEARRTEEAELRSGWERDYRAPIDEAFAGDSKRICDLLRAHRPLSETDFDYFADFLEATAQRSPGRQWNEPVHRAVAMATAIKGTFGTASAVHFACAEAQREGTPVGPEQVRDLLRRPKSRRQPKSQRRK